jgi:transporter family-2 protein
VAVIAGQLIMSLLVDHLGWLNNAQIPLDASRYIAIVLLLAAIGLLYLSHRRKTPSTNVEPTKTETQRTC